MTAVSALRPGTENKVVLGNLGLSAPKTTTAGVTVLRPDSSAARNAVWGSRAGRSRVAA